MRFQRIGEVMHIHHCTRDPGLGQPIKRVVNQRLACNPHQRFGLRRG